ncbi:hypothetical protein VULLAG_LOCUS3173 [Vulpes lagopus]
MGPHSELKATSDTSPEFINRMSFNQLNECETAVGGVPQMRGHYRLLRRKAVSQQPQTIPTAAWMVAQEAVPCPPGTLSSGPPSRMKRK